VSDRPEPVDARSFLAWISHHERLLGVSGKLQRGVTRHRFGVRDKCSRPQVVNAVSQIWRIVSSRLLELFCDALAGRVGQIRGGLQAEPEVFAAGRTSKASHQDLRLWAGGIGGGSLVQ
jgi:hypothetical protein